MKMEEENKVEELITVKKSDLDYLVKCANYLKEKVEELTEKLEPKEIDFDLSGFHDMIKVTDEIIEDDLEEKDLSLYREDGVTLKEPWEINAK